MWNNGWCKTRPSMHYTHSSEHSVRPRSFATKSSNYHPNVVREGEHQQHIQPQNSDLGFWQDKTECRTCTTQFNSTVIAGLFCNLCWPFGNYNQGQHILLFHHRWTRNTAWRGTNTPASNKLHAQLSKTKKRWLLYQLQRCSAQGICSTGSNCKPKFL